MNPHMSDKQIDTKETLIEQILEGSFLFMESLLAIAYAPFEPIGVGTDAYYKGDLAATWAQELQRNASPLWIGPSYSWNMFNPLEMYDTFVVPLLDYIDWPGYGDNKLENENQQRFLDLMNKGIKTGASYTTLYSVLKAFPALGAPLAIAEFVYWAGRTIDTHATSARAAERQSNYESVILANTALQDNRLETYVKWMKLGISDPYRDQDITHSQENYEGTERQAMDRILPHMVWLGRTLEKLGLEMEMVEAAGGSEEELEAVRQQNSDFLIRLLDLTIQNIGFENTDIDNFRIFTQNEEFSLKGAAEMMHGNLDDIASLFLLEAMMGLEHSFFEDESFNGGEAYNYGIRKRLQLKLSDIRSQYGEFNSPMHVAEYEYAAKEIIQRLDQRLEYMATSPLYQVVTVVAASGKLPTLIGLNDPNINMFLAEITGLLTYKEDIMSGGTPDSDFGIGYYMKLTQSQWVETIGAALESSELPKGEVDDILAGDLLKDIFYYAIGNLQEITPLYVEMMLEENGFLDQWALAERLANAFAIHKTEGAVLEEISNLSTEMQKVIREVIFPVFLGPTLDDIYSKYGLSEQAKAIFAENILPRNIDSMTAQEVLSWMGFQGHDTNRAEALLLRQNRRYDPMSIYTNNLRSSSHLRRSRAISDLADFDPVRTASEIHARYALSNTKINVATPNFAEYQFNEARIERLTDVIVEQLIQGDQNTAFQQEEKADIPPVIVKGKAIAKTNLAEKARFMRDIGVNIATTV